MGWDECQCNASTSTGVLTLDAANTAVFKVELEGQAIVGTATTADTTKTLRDASVADLVTKINANSTLTGKGIKAVALADAAVVGSAAATPDGGGAAKIEFKGSATTAGMSWEIKGTDADGKAISETVAGIAATTANSSTNEFLTVESITATGSYATAATTVSIGSDGGTATDIRTATAVTAGAVEMNGASVNGRIELLDGADDMSSSTKAMHAVTVIDAAIKTVNTQRSELGAISNRLTHTVSNMTNVSTNLSAARGGIEDADFALETTNLAKNQILQQASTAMLAQANASKQNVLSLLQ